MAKYEFHADRRLFQGAILGLMRLNFLSVEKTFMTSSVRKLAKRMAFAALGNPMAVRLRMRQIAKHQALTVLCLHRVAPMDDSTYPPMDPGLFRQMLAFCQAHFTIMTFAELSAEQGTEGWSKPPLALTFDDGYKDFADYSAPIMAEFGVRCNLNLIPSAIESGLPPFNVSLNDYAGRAPEEHLAALDVPDFAPFSPGESRYVFGNALSTHFKNRSMAEQKKLADIIRPQLARSEEFKPSAMMSLAEARQVAEIHEIGAHSFEHANLGQESDDYAMQDARRCREWFAREMSLAPTIYALPNGDYRKEQLPLIAGEGFSTLLLVEQRFSAISNNVHCRFNIDATGVSEMRFKAMGGLAGAARLLPLLAANEDMR